MSKHKIFAQSPSYFTSAVDMTPNGDNNSSPSVLDSSKQSLKRRKLTSTPVALKTGKVGKPNFNGNEIENESLNNNAPNFNSDPEGNQSRNPLDNEENCQKDDFEEEHTISEDDNVERDFFSKFHHKLPYTLKEDELILKYVLQGQNIFRVSSILLWKHLEAKKENPQRTYQSLKNRFLRNIKPKIFTTFRHLVNDQDTVDRILTKFPELKKEMGVQNTLSKIEFGDSNKNLKSSTSSEVRLQNRDPRKSQSGVKRKERREIRDADQSPAVENRQSVIPFISISLFSTAASQNFKREIKIENNSISVSVNLKIPKYLKTSIPSFLTMSERFKKLAANSEQVYCSACGRISSRPIGGEPADSSTESDVLISNSVDSTKNKEQSVSLSLSSLARTRHKRHSSSSESSSSSTDSQVLFIYEEETSETELPSENAVEANDENNEGLNSTVSRNEGNEVANKESEAAMAKTNKADNIPSSSVDKPSTLHSGDLDQFFENTVGEFRKLINADEEKILSKKCLYKNRDWIGFNADLKKNLESYFLESSQELETPTLTDNFTATSNLRENNPENPVNSILVSNMMKMLGNEEEKNKTS